MTIKPRIRNDHYTKTIWMLIQMTELEFGQASSAGSAGRDTPH